MIILKNATYIDWQTLNFTISDICVEDGIDGKISFTNYPVSHGAQTMDCSGLLVDKILCCRSSSCVFCALARGMGAPKKHLITSMKF